MNVIAEKLTFSAALALLKDGRRVSRAGWNGKGMWLVLVRPHAPQAHTTTYAVRLEATGAREAEVAASLNTPAGSGVTFFDWLYAAGGADVKLLPWIGMKTADDGFVPWLASQTDLLADDWCEVVP